MAETTDERMAAGETVEDRAEAERQHRRVEQQRMKWAGIVLAALALFAGGYAVGQAVQDDDGPVASDGVVTDDELPPAIEERLDRIEERLEDFDLTIPDAVPRGPFGGRDGFELPDDFPCRMIESDDGTYRFECDFGGEFQLPEGFEDCPFFGGDCPWLDNDSEQPGDVSDRGGFLGVEISETARGVVVRSVVEGSPAADAGIELRDVVLEFDGVEIESADALADLITDAGAGAEVEITLLRSGSEVTVGVVLGARPD